MFTYRRDQPACQETTCDLLLNELQEIWDEVGESEAQRDAMLVEFEQMCIDSYRKKVDEAKKCRAQLQQAIADSEAEIADICSAMGEQPVHFDRKSSGSLKKALESVISRLEEMRKLKTERKNQILEILYQLQKISIELYGNKGINDYLDENNLSLKRLEELRSQLVELQNEKLEHQEYGSDDDDVADEDESLAEKFKLALSDHLVDSQGVREDKYKAPADVILRCREYAKNYEIENEDKDIIVVEESSDESEVWNCETNVSRYSNLYNRPRIIEAPKVTRKKKSVEIVSASSNSSSQVISLEGKGKLPVDLLLGNKRTAAEQADGVGTMRTEQYKRKQLDQESKEERTEGCCEGGTREARRIKKETKRLRKSAALSAQKTAAKSGPCFIHIL